MEEKSNKYLLPIIVILTILICIVVVFGVLAQNDDGSVIPTPEIQQQEKIGKKPQIISVEKTIEVETVTDGIRDMGSLITEEYYFSDVLTNSSVKKLFDKITLQFTESSYAVKYDGVVTAGIDMTKARIEKDDDSGTITVYIPKATIQTVDIDPESFVLISEKQGVLNSFSAKDYNDSLIELERNAREKAISRGILDKADENGAKIISNFINSILVDFSYDIIVVKE